MIVYCPYHDIRKIGTTNLNFDCYHTMNSRGMRDTSPHYLLELSIDVLSPDFPNWDYCMIMSKQA